MFDKYVKNVSTSPDRIDVTVNAAPTDDSVRLYGELLARARSEVLGTLTVDNSLVNFGAAKVSNDLSQAILVVFNLNGRTFRCETRLDPLKPLSMMKEELMEYVIRTISEDITLELMKALKEERHG